MIYLDNAATTFPKPENVYLAVDRLTRECSFNAGRGESLESEKALRIIEEARSAVSSLVPNSNPSGVVFASSATDALNKIILGLDLLEGDTVYVSPFEHNAVVRPLKRLENLGVKIAVLPFDEETWKLDRGKMLDEFALNEPSAVFISHISNATGFELPVDEIFAESAKYNAVNVLDAAQSLGVHPLPVLAHCDYIVFAGHKTLYGIFGVGGFIALHDRGLEAIIRGGTGSDSLNPEMPDQIPNKYESGSLNTIAIGCLIDSIQWLKTESVSEHEAELTKYFITRLATIPKIKIFFPKNIVPCGIVSIAVSGYSSSEVGLLLSRQGISVRTGYHCAPLVHDFIGSMPYEGTIRFSFGAFNTKEEIDAVIGVLGEL